MEKENSKKNIKCETVPIEKLSDADVRKLAHELQVHHVELETQIDELRKTQRQQAESLWQYSELYEHARTGYFTFDRNGLILGSNLTAVTQLRKEKPSLINTKFSDYIIREDADIETFYLHLGKIFKDKTEQVCFIRLKGNRDVEFCAELYSLPVYESDEVIRCVTSVTDITMEIQLTDKLIQTELYTRNLVNSSPEMIISVNLDRNIITFNPAAEKVFGYTGNEVLGRHVEILYADKSQGIQVHNTVKETGKFEGEVLNRRKDANTFTAHLSTSVLRDSEGKMIGFMGISHDITERKQM